MDARHAAPGALRERALVPVLVFLGMVVAVISSLGSPLVPTIASVDHVSLSDAQWSLTITLLVGAVATPTMGRLGDGPHRRRVIIGATAVVLLGSVLAALPLGFGFLIVGRGLQGLGLGLTPLAIATARDALPAERSRPAVALLSITTVAGVGLGYPLTGLIAESWGVHAGFWFGAIISALALTAAVLVVPNAQGREKRPLDALGAVLLAVGLAGLLLALSEGEIWGWGSSRLIGLTAVAVVLLVWWAVHELRTEHPLVDLRSLRNRVVLTADVSGLIAGVAMYMLMSMVTRFVQTPSSAGYGFGTSVLVTGLVLLPFSAASVASSKLVPLLARRTSTALVLPVGCAVSLLSMVMFLFARNSLWELFVIMGVAGLGVGCTFAVMPGLIVSSVPAHETGSAISFNQVLRTVGYSTGSVLSAVILEAHTPVGRLLPENSGYQAAAWLGCAVWVVTAVVTIVLPRRGAPARGTVTVDEELLMDESIADAETAEDSVTAPAAGPAPR
ncbi:MULTISPECIES: MFS transporter [Streptacidiphilus]|uniref:MFS transporter n=1 Tax=Streptacidiphilus cavernicola TaxID=3342716 RepID=A0ABV6V023_9ACTN|nr:MFS transporter [Streptacidiphilus jeojiense]